MRLMRKWLGGLRGKILIAVLLASTLTGIAVGALSYYIARDSIKDQVENNLSNMARDIEGIIKSMWIPTIERQVQILAGIAEKLYGIYAEPEIVGAGLAEIQGRTAAFVRVSVFNADGSLAVSSDPDYDPGYLAEFDGLEAWGTVIIPFRTTGEPPEQENLMTIAVPIVVDGDVAGVLAGDISPKPLGEELGMLRVGISAEVYMVNSAGQLLSIPPKAGGEKGLEILGDPLDTEVVRLVTSGKSGVAEYNNYAGEKVLGSYVWIPEMGWGLIVEENANLAFAQLNTLRSSVVVLVFGLAVIALIASLFLSRRISKPLVSLKTGAEKLGLGDLGYRVEIEGGEEMGGLARSFNRMAEAIQSSHEMMEVKVNESTQELRVLSSMITSLSRTMSPDEILQRALQLFIDFTEYEIGWCYLAGEDGWKLLYCRCPSESLFLVPEAVRPGEGLLGRIMQSGDAAFWGTLEESEYDEVLRVAPQGSMAVLPLRSPSRVLGMIALASPQHRRLSGEAKATLRAMADEVGMALENTLLYLELREHVSELEKANRELRGLDEMKSNFISAVTHELKQPLSLIGGYTQTIYDYYDNLTYEEEMHCLRVIMERTRFLSSLVEDLLDISMLEMGRVHIQTEELDLVALARKEAEEYAEGFKEMPIVVDFPADFPTVIADARRIEQVLSNLLSNAVKFSEGTGEIRISGIIKEDRVRVRVEDLGIGIDPLHLEKIFDRFYQADSTTRRPYPGVGLGLFICRQLIEAHKGRIWAENRPEGGSAFIFELPLDPGTWR